MYSALTSNLAIWLSYEMDIAGIIWRADNVILYKSSIGPYFLTLGHMDFKRRDLQIDASITRYTTLTHT